MDESAQVYADQLEVVSRLGLQASAIKMRVGGWAGGRMDGLRACVSLGEIGLVTHRRTVK